MYRRLMRAGARLGCHQLPERSFFICEIQLPLCARCTGVLLGYLVALALVWFVRPNAIVSAALLLPMAVDGCAQRYYSRMSNNPRRLVTGLAFGYGLMSLCCIFIMWMLGL